MVGLGDVFRLVVIRVGWTMRFVVIVRTEHFFTAMLFEGLIQHAESASTIPPEKYDARNQKNHHVNVFSTSRIRLVISWPYTNDTPKKTLTTRVAQTRSHKRKRRYGIRTTPAAK